jgi:hypothetical protein
MAKAKGAAAQRRPRSSRSAGGVRVMRSARPRPAMLEVDVDYSCEDNYLFSYLGNDRSLGIFVRTLTPAPLGTFLILRFAPLGRGVSAIGASASGVIRVNPPAEVVAKATPMGMRKLGIDDPLEPGSIAGSGQHLIEGTFEDEAGADGEQADESIEGSLDGSIEGSIDSAIEGSIDEVIEDATERVAAPPGARVAGAGELAEVELADSLDLELEADLDAELGAHTTELKIEGEVIWVNPYRPSVKDNLHPGMGVRFVAIDAVTHRRLLALVGRVAYL